MVLGSGPIQVGPQYTNSTINANAVFIIPMKSLK